MPQNKPLVIQLAKRQLTEFVFDAVNLEGINMTLPEIQTLLDGITVGGHEISDQQIVLNQAKTWKELFKLVESDSFELSANTACMLHAIAGKEEALKWGRFRDAGVTISGTDYVPPEPDRLPMLFDTMVEESNKIRDIYESAFHVFLDMSRTQYFFDVNKRMGRFMMNGVLLNAGYPAINIQAKRRLKFNMGMIGFYDTGNKKPMDRFLRGCMDTRTVKIVKRYSTRSIDRTL